MKLVFGDLKMRSLFFMMKTAIVKNCYPPLSEIKPKVIFLCNKIEAHGGLSDRMHGMISVYKLCRELGLEYKLAHFHPFDISLYLQPNKVDWYIPEEYVDMNKHNVVIVDCPILPNKITGFTDRQGFYYHLNRLTKALKKASKKGKQIHVYSNTSLTTPEEYNKYFHELFKPSEDLQRQVDWNLQQIGGEFVSVSTRFQNLMGDFKDGNAKALDSEEEKKEYIRKCIGKVEEIHGKHPDKKMLVTSDSARFIEEVKKLPYVYVIPGKIGHVDYSPSNAHDIHLKTFLDLLTLSESSKLYYIVTGKMYGGHFAETASFINNRPYEVIRF